MKEKSDVLLERAIRIIRIKSVLLIALIVTLEITVLTGNQFIVHLQVAAGILLLVLLLTLIADRYKIWLPLREMKKFEEELAKSDLIYEERRAPYVYSSMGRDLEARMLSLLSRQKTIDSSRQQSQYLALQNQINPHFLYNTLDAIRSDAMLAGEMRIADTIETLSTYFAYTISNMDQFATLSEELEHIKDYFYIQKYRFEERLNLKIDNLNGVDIHELCIPRLTLQPLVENAIYHGLEGRQKHGTVTIEFMQTENYLIIDVIDDGLGMAPQQLRQINDRLQHLENTEKKEDRHKTGGIALINVNSRIKLLFGDGYGLRLYSAPGEGTTVKILLKNVLREDVNAKRTFENS